MKTTLLKKTIFALTIMVSSFTFAQEVTFDSTSMTIDTNGAILLVDGNTFDATTNPLKFSQVDLAASIATMFCTLRTDWADQGNKNGGTNISASNNTPMVEGTLSAQTVMGPGAVAASTFTLSTAITSGQANIHVALRSKNSSAPNVFVGDAFAVTVVVPLSVKENTLEGVSVFSNTSANTISVKSLQGGDISLYNLLGTKVKSASTLSKNYELQASGLAAGIYVFRMTSEGKTATKKLIIK